MNIELRFPKITAADEKGQLAQIKSYLHQMAEQLNMAFQAVETVGTSSHAQSTVSVAKTERNDPSATFNSIKGLIIKSADIVQAYAGEINRSLEGIYVANSDFGEYKEETALDIEENSKDIKLLFTNVQSIQKEAEETRQNTAAYLNYGLLYTSEELGPVYGLEIGQRTEQDGVQKFNQYARFTPSKLSFYDDHGNEVAWISDNQLFIKNVYVTDRFREGSIEDTVEGDSIVTRYVGGVI